MPTIPGPKPTLASSLQALELSPTGTGDTRKSRELLRHTLSLQERSTKCG